MKRKRAYNVRREAINWEFYYTDTLNPHTKQGVKVFKCRAPSRTKIYKDLLNKLSQPHINSIGYEIYKPAIQERTVNPS